MATISKQALEMWKVIHFQGIAPPTACEMCGLSLPTHANAINLSFAAFVGVPGHPSLPAFGCPASQVQATEHWACSVECWRQMAINCIENDMVPLLTEGLERVHGDLMHTKEGLQKNGS